MKTVREIVLEAEVERLTSALEVARVRHGVDLSTDAFLDIPCETVRVTPLPPTLTLPLMASWSVERDETRCNLSAIGIAHKRDERLQVGWFQEEHALSMSRGGACNVLGALHERTIEELVHIYKGGRL
jgi:hypothetical protein